MFYSIIDTFARLVLLYLIVISIAYSLLIKNDKFKLNSKHFIREVKYSVLSLFLFSVIANFLYGTKLIEYTKLYYNISEYGWVYYFSIIPIMFILYDLHFYVTHRIMHHKKLFNLFHITHHKSKVISPLTALSMDALEAFINQSALVLLFFLFPIHTTHVYIWVIVTISYTIYLHSGVELFPNKFLQTKIGKLINTTKTHSEHHLKFKDNYGYYTLIWDKLFKTERNA
jgi:sterol desaturase/sphingolipid hydroxylase (fatty acid hydroxylase superfamily)